MPSRQLLSSVVVHWTVMPRDVLRLQQARPPTGSGIWSLSIKLWHPLTPAGQSPAALCWRKLGDRPERLMHRGVVCHQQACGCLLALAYADGRRRTAATPIWQPSAIHLPQEGVSWRQQPAAAVRRLDSGNRHRCRRRPVHRWRLQPLHLRRRSGSLAAPVGIG